MLLPHERQATAPECDSLQAEAADGDGRPDADAGGKRDAGQRDTTIDRRADHADGERTVTAAPAGIECCYEVLLAAAERFVVARAAYGLDLLEDALADLGFADRRRIRGPGLDGTPCLRRMRPVRHQATACFCGASAAIVLPGMCRKVIEKRHE